MTMADLKQFEFCLLRYVPNVVRGEFVNIGLLLFEPQPDGFGFADVRMTSDWRRATCLDRQVDIEVLQALEADVRTRLQHPQDVGSLLHKLEDSFANLIQISPRKVCLAAEPIRELETLCSLYLEEPQLGVLPVANRQKGERAVILAQIKDAFTRAGIWSLLFTQIPAAKYTKKKGDPLVFDFGYVIGNEVRFFQSVPLRANVNQAVILANRFPRIAECILGETQASAHLTAVVADDLDRQRPDIEFALDAFKENHVQLAAAAEMPSIAERARQDLKA
jgi:Protein of unknown function (DUF3037)